MAMTQSIRSAGQLGVLIREERLRRGMTQQELADRSGTGQKTISRVETGHEGASLETIFRLLAVLGLEIRFSPRDIGTGKSISDVF
jgi:HTH-type transcriptional regulator/antitoxin HipB